MKKINFKKIKSESQKKLKFPKIRKNKIKPEKEETNLDKVKKKNKKIRIGYYLLVLITFFAIWVFVGGIGFCYYIVKSAPEFDPEALYQKEATLIYDASNNLIATLGTEKREKVSYNELPEVLIDAIVATEDSRFFQHNGFDFPRFVKASIGQLLGNSGAGGASTLTMQVSKNSFTSTESSGIAGIIRKFTDIYMSIFKIEKKYTKQEILELYVNSPYLGSGSYGVEQASQTYFGKNAKDLSLSEAALIAGLFQAPNGYDPYLNPNDSEARRNQVLNLMVRHGYIDKETAEIAKQVKVKDLLVADEYTITNEYQGFIDTVVQAVIDDTGNNPYEVPMIIYSTMVASKQDVINDFYNGNLGYKFKDNKIQVGISVIDNRTGAIIAVGAGRNKKGEMTFNFATDTNAHPGSTAKPIFEYGPGIENYKWSTYTPFFDEPTKYSSGGTMNNYNSVYDGFSTLKYCLSKSKNTCALQAFQQIDNKIIYDYVTSVGITPESTNGYVGEAHSVGGFTGVSPVTLGAAYSVFGNGGYYTKPYSYTKLIYRETEEEIETDITKTKVLSEQTAYLITNILYSVTPGSVRVPGTRVATKTGTSSYDKTLLKKYGLSSSIIRDSWVATYSPDYTLTFWYGYEKLDDEHYACKCYNTMGSASENRRAIQGLLVNGIFERNSSFKNPGGIVSVEVELETIPGQRPSEFTPSDLRETHMFISGSEPTETSTRFSKLSAPSNLVLNEVGTTVHASWASPGTPSAIDRAYLENYFNSGYGDYAAQYLQYRIDYNNAYIGKFGFEVYLVKGTTTKYIGFTENANYDIDLTQYPGSWDSVLVKSAYSIFKTNASDGVTSNLTSFEAPTIIDVSMKNIALSKNSNWSGSTKSDINKITVNDTEITNYTATLQIASIKKSDNTEIAINNMTKDVGTYTVSYMITFEYTSADGKVKKYTKTTTQEVIVSE